MLFKCLGILSVQMIMQINLGKFVSNLLKEIIHGCFLLILLARNILKHNTDISRTLLQDICLTRIQQES